MQRCGLWLIMRILRLTRLPGKKSRRLKEKRNTFRLLYAVSIIIKIVESFRIKTALKGWFLKYILLISLMCLDVLMVLFERVFWLFSGFKSDDNPGVCCGN